MAEVAGEVKLILSADGTSWSAELDKAQRSLNKLKGATGETARHTRAEMTEAKHAIHLVGDEIGVHLPRALQGFVAHLPGVAKAMAAAFDTVAVIGLVMVLVETGKKIFEWHEKREEEAKKTSEALKKMASEIASVSAGLELSNSKIEDTIAKLEHKPAENAMKTALLEASDQADKLGEKLDKDLEKLSDIKVSSGLTGLFTGGPSETDKAAGGAARRLQEIIDSYTPVLARVAESGDRGNYNRVRGEELNRIAVDPELNKNLAALEKYLNANQDLVGKRNAEFDKAADAYQILAGAARTLNQQQQEEIGKQTISTLQAAEDAKGSDEDAADALRRQVESPNTSTFYTPFHDLAKSMAKEQSAYAADDAKLLAEQTRDNAKNFVEWLQAQQGAGVSGAFAANLPSVRLATAPSPLNPAVQGAVNALDELAKSFTDITAIMHSLVTNSLNTVNSSILKTMTDPYHRGDWKAAGKSIASGIAGTGLTMAEGSLMKAFGVGSHKPTGAPGDPYSVRIVGSSLASGAASVVSGVTAAATSSAGSTFGKILGTVLSAVPFMAAGGTLETGMPAIVGERGPELFIPSGAGRIVPNGALQGATHVWNIDARGSSDPAAVRFAVQRGIMEAAPRIAAGSIAAQRDMASRKPVMAR
jgi:hypothetical protein